MVQEKRFDSDSQEIFEKIHDDLLTFIQQRNITLTNKMDFKKRPYSTLNMLATLNYVEFIDSLNLDRKIALGNPTTSKYIQEATQRFNVQITEQAQTDTNNTNKTCYVKKH